MKKICILTATRAEYGLLKPIIKNFQNQENIDVKIAVTGAHLSPEFGMTYEEIINDGLEIDKKVEILLSSDTPSAISKSMGLAIIAFSDYFSETQPDLLVVLGDRFETLAIAIVAMNQRIPIAHLYGGEATEGLIDESIRHAITKLSYLHFTSTDEYRRRVIQLGEDPLRVFNVGAVGVENIHQEVFMTKNELSDSLNLSLNKPFALVTFHPVTLENQSSEVQMNELLQAISMNEDMSFIFTKANSDTNGRIINLMIDNFVKDKENCIAVTSLGSKRYLSALKYCYMVIGNSSSGIIEAPTFKIPTINIGDRQKGRIQANSVINCLPVHESIQAAIDMAKSNEFRTNLHNITNPYGKENTASNIVSIIMEFLLNKRIDIKKRFFDVNQLEV